jgi:hypothetical protein
MLAVRALAAAFLRLKYRQQVFFNRSGEHNWRMSYCDQPLVKVITQQKKS